MKKSTASKKLIRVIVERHEDGTYWGTTQNIPGVVSAYGSRLELLKSNIEAAFKDYLVLATEEGYDWVLDLIATWFARFDCSRSCDSSFVK